MGKGKLKEALHNKKVLDRAAKEKNAKIKAAQEQQKDDGPTTVTKEDLIARAIAEQEAEAAKEQKLAQEKKELAEEAEEAKEYDSNVLSKKEQRKLKKAIKAKLALEEAAEESGNEEEEGESHIEIAEDDDSEMEEYLLDLEKLARSDSEDESEDEDDDDEDDEEDDEEEVEGEDVPLSDVEIDSDADIVPHTKLTINNVAAINNALERIQLPWSKHSFQEHQTITSSEPVESQIKDIYDDTERELAFYKQAFNASLIGRANLLKLKVPFTRPQDYFAEMIKSDEHMDKLKQKLIKEASEKKASVDARRQRDLKKFGKQVQNQTLQDRQKQKRDTLEKIKSLKRKRQNDEITGDAFDIAIEEAAADQDERKDRSEKRHKPNSKRTAKNAKYGSGGMKRFKRKNDADSSNDVSGFSSNKMKGKSARPGKSKRSKR
jgi:rRNA-processing protein EBP2